MSEQSREEFKKWYFETLSEDDRNSIRQRSAWIGWIASRQSMVVKLPELCDGENSCKCYYESQSIEDALDTAGVLYE